MKISVDVDITPEELRRFLGLPNVEKIQTELVKNAQKYLKETSQSQYQDLVSSALQPMMAYQNWLQKMMSGENGSPSRDTKKDGNNSDE